MTDGKRKKEIIKKKSLINDMIKLVLPDIRQLFKIRKR